MLCHAKANREQLSRLIIHSTPHHTTFSQRKQPPRVPSITITNGTAAVRPLSRDLAQPTSYQPCTPATQRVEQPSGIHFPFAPPSAPARGSARITGAVTESIKQTWALHYRYLVRA
ncbi:hypothetical protein M3J09_000921 [Ascochyta lentis]